MKPTLRVLTYNTHLFGSAGLLDGRETGLYYRDHERVPLIIEAIKRLEGERPLRERIDVIGFTEVWDDELRSQLIEGLRPIFPHALHSPEPSPRGIVDVMEHTEKIFPGFIARRFRDRAPEVVDYFSTSHYDVKHTFWRGLQRHFLSEDRFVSWVLQGLLGVPIFSGNGLLYASKLPIQKGRFSLFP